MRRVVSLFFSVGISSAPIHLGIYRTRRFRMLLTWRTMSELTTCVGCRHQAVCEYVLGIAVRYPFLYQLRYVAFQSLSCFVPHERIPRFGKYFYVRRPDYGLK